METYIDIAPSKDKEVCSNCSLWLRWGVQTGTCANENSYYFTLDTNQDDSCENFEVEINKRITMPQFEIEFKSHDIIEAKDFEEARKLFIEKHSIPDQATSFYNCETHEIKDVIGHCEVSELPIFEDDEFCSDDEGVMWLKREEE